MLLAAILVAAVLLFFDFPQPETVNSQRISVELMQQVEPEEILPEPVEPELLELPLEEIVAIPDQNEAAEVQETLVEEPQAIDWQAAKENAVRETVALMNQDNSMHPEHAEAKRLAGINFAPSRAPVKKPIWENVEIDQMGRKILRDGNCYRVLEDWRATYQDIQREFGQYIRYCDAVEEVIIDVDWVDDVGQNYAYLRHKDGEIPADELNELLRRPPLLAQE